MIELRDHNMPPHCRLLASAGSGKTYQLASRYLALLVRDQPPRGILATTFTRLAAGEIRNRIIMRLVDAIDDTDNIAQLSTAVDAAVNNGDVFHLLRALTESLHGLQVRTLDSFFAAVVQNFAPELGIPIGCALADDAQTVNLRDDAVARLLSDGDEQELVGLLRQLTMRDSIRSVHDTIDQHLRDLYDLSFHITDGAWDCIDPPSSVLQQSQIESAIENFKRVDLPDDKRIAKQHENACMFVDQGAWSAFLACGLAKKIVAGESSYYKKPIADDVVGAYHPLISHARSVIVNNLRHQNRATAPLLAQFAEHYGQLKHRNRLLTFSDLAPLLEHAVRTNRSDELYFRLDASIDHLLLDEFQDTSIAQWNALQPIVTEILADTTSGRSFFCVGDVKQSIYGWRDAAPEVLEQLPELIFESGTPASFDGEPLRHSRRSAQPVIDTINDVFQSLIGNHALREYTTVADRWTSLYRQHETVRTELPGYAELRTTPQVANGQADSVCLISAAQLAAQLHRQAPHATIGILTRRNRAVGRILYELGPDRLNAPAGGRGTGSLTDAPVVEALFDLLAVADHPDDTIAAYHIANSPVSELYDIPGNLADADQAAHRLRLSRRVRRELAEDGYGPTIARWAQHLAASCSRREGDRLVQLIDLADQFDAGPQSSRRPDDFIRLVETLEIPDVRLAPIQVMTIHKAKGLEFDIVILPDLNVRLRGQGNPTVAYQRDGLTGPITKISRFPNAHMQQLLPDLKPMCDHTINNIVHESLSLLYVALTRARHGLYMLIDPPSETSKAIGQTLAGVLLGSLVSNEIADIEPDRVLFRHGNENWTDDLPTKSPAVDDVETINLPIVVPPATTRVHDSPAPSAHDDESNLSERRDAQADDRGTALHALFEGIEWLPSDGAAQVDDAELARMVRRALPHRPIDWVRDIAHQFHDMVQQPTIRKSLQQPASTDAAHRFEVHREMRFVQSSGDGLQTGVIDRLVLERAGDKVIAATIIDFKSDRITPEDAPQRAEHYRRQLEHYRAAAADTFKLDPADIQMVVLFVTADAAIEL